MTVAQDQQLARIVAQELGVAASYRHAPKRVVAGEPLAAGDALLKWYEVYADGKPVPEPIAAAAREHLARTPLEAKGLGFVVLHRCGEAFYFLIVSTWRNENELWETVYYKDAGMTAFAPFPRDGEHKPMMCVWELVPAWHEQQAWTRFLATPRDAAAAQRWLDERYSGAA
jgi:hypothetical protein